MTRAWQQPRYGTKPRPDGWDRPGLTPKLSVADKRRLQELLHQQMWCWGRDVLHAAPPGNLLVWAGMTRHGSDAPGERGSNRYSVALPRGGVLSLWAFGVAVVDDGGFGVFLHRYLRGVRVLPARWQPAGVRQAEQLPALQRPVSPGSRDRSAELLDRLLRWIERYERDVLALLGPEYRTRTLARWEHPIVEGPAMADEWQRLGSIYRRASAARPCPAHPPWRGPQSPADDSTVKADRPFFSSDGLRERMAGALVKADGALFKAGGALVKAGGAVSKAGGAFPKADGALFKATGLIFMKER